MNSVFLSVVVLLLVVPAFRCAAQGPPPANYSVTVPSANHSVDGGANLTYTLVAAFNTTGRIAVVQNPRKYFHVYCAGCTATGRCTGVLETVAMQAEVHQCRYATNGGPFALGDCLSPIISNGTLVNNASQGSFQAVGMLRNGSWMWGAIPPDLYPEMENMMCGFNWLVVDYQLLTFSDIEIAPRTAFGLDENGALITLVAEGSEVAFTGLTMNQTAVWMRQLGAKYAINMDGGGSSTSYWADNGGVQGCPTCIDQPYCCSRAVSTIMCIPHDF